MATHFSLMLFNCVLGNTPNTFVFSFPYIFPPHNLTTLIQSESVLDPRKCEYLKDYSLDFEYAYMTTYLAS